MLNKNYSLWIEAESRAPGEWDIDNGNTDVVVEFEDKTRWAASFFTYKHIEQLVERNKTTGECLNGKYFWSSDMILVDRISKESIDEVVKHLLNQGSFASIFGKI